MRTRLFLLTLLCYTGASARARADQGEWILAIEPGAALLKVADRNAWGGGGTLDISRAVTDAVALRATGGFTAHSLPDLIDKNMKPMPHTGGLTLAWNAGLGITYAIDLDRLFPYVELAAGVLGTVIPDKGVNKSTFDVGVEVGLGVDYMITKHIAVGIIVRYHAYLTNVLGSLASTAPSYIYFGPRVAFHLGG